MPVKALTGIGYARAKRRQQIFVATSSVGPGATNMVTAAGVAMSNRLPILFLPGDTYANRLPDPVLQQVEHFNNPGITANDAFKPVTRYFDRITRPEQIIQSFPAAVQTMLDPADCGPAGPQSAGSNMVCTAAGNDWIICSGLVILSKYLVTGLKASFAVIPGLLKCSTCCNTGSGNLFAYVSPGKNNIGSLLLIATPAAVTMFVAPGPTDDVATKICCLLFALA